MRQGLDTSVVLRLLTGEPRHQAERARATIAAARDPMAVSDLVVGEAYFALRHHYAVPHGEAVRALLGLVSDAKVTTSGIARAVLSDPDTARVAKGLPGLVDRLILAEHARDDVGLLTFDKVLAGQPGARLLE